MAEHRMMLGFPNRIDEAAINGGAWQATLPLDNLKTRLLARVARSTDLVPANTQFDLDFGRGRRFRILSLGAHSISLRGRVRYTAFADAERQTVVFSTGWKNAWGSIVGASWRVEDQEWRSSNWYLGSFNAEEIEGFTPFTTEVLETEVSARYWRVEIDDQGNPDGYVQIGRVFFGEAWQPRINRVYGGGLGTEVASSVETALGGAKFFDRREPIRVIRFSLQHMKGDEAHSRALQLVRRANVTEEVFVIPDPSQPLLGLYQNFMGRIRVPGALEEAMWGNGGTSYSMSFEIEELR